MIKYFLFLILLVSSLAEALEADNYMTWDRDLNDSADKINGYFEEQIQLALSSAKKEKRTLNCREITLSIAERFRTFPPKLKPLEDWIDANLDESYVYPKGRKFLSETIYQDPYRFFLKWYELSLNIQINGYYLGTDKLSHFVSTGRRYFEIYSNRISSGWPEKEAEIAAIDMGLNNEATVLGLYASGVFSYGDVEANYQGLKFYKRFCMDKENTFLKQDDNGQWIKVQSFDIKNYVNPYWDESYNESYRLPFNRMRVEKVIFEKYCSLFHTKRVQDRFKYYDSYKDISFSRQYVKEQQKLFSSRAPSVLKQYAVKYLCSNLND